MNVIIKNVFGFLIAMTAVCLTAHAQFAGGTGTEDDPWQITTLAQLDSVRNHTGNSNAPVFYKLMNDLTFSASDDLNAEAPGNFEPVRYFSYSSFDGNGKTISGLVIEKTGSGSYTGLFEEIYSDCYVRNLGLVNCSITSSYSNVGGIAGISVGEITACFVSGTITATGAYAGGIVGHNSGGSINACYNAATVSNPNGGAGGIARSVTNGSIHSCYNIGNVSGKSGSNVGAIVGYVSSSVVTNCYYLTGSGGGNGTQLSETEMKAAAFIDTLNAPFLISYWKAGNSDNNGFPVHVWWNGGTIDYKGETADNPFLITSIPDLNKMRNYIRLKRFWRLENDLDFGNDDYNGEATGNFDPIGGEGFSAAFAGDVEGNNKKITGLKIEQTRTYVGLFGYFIGSIRNLSIENADIKSSLYYVGGFAGSLTGTVENCSFDGTVVSGSMYVGGIAGEIVANNFIRNCTNKGTITGRSDVSGIAGRISSSYGIESHVENCVNEGNIIGTSGGSNISGLTGGTHTSDCRNSGTVYAPECDYVSGLGGGTRCFNEGNVTGRKYVSGLGGGKPSGSYNTGNITGEEFVGGITYAVSAYSTVYWGNAGSGASGSYPSPQIAGCFNIGEVTGKRNVGGISPGKYTSSGSFYIKEKVHSEDHKVIEIEEGAQGITEEQMKSAVVVNAMNVAIHNSFSSLGDHHWHYVSGDIPAYYEPEGGDAPVYTVFLNITPFGVPVEIDGIRFNTKSSGYYSNMKLPEGDYSVKLGDYADATQQSYHVNPSNSTNTLSLNTGITGISDGNGGKIFQLYTPEHVHLMRYANSSSFELMNDITLESQHDFSLTEGNFYSILNFAGSLNGKGHAIRNLTIRGDSLDGVGLFESVSSSRNTGGFDYGWDSRISNLRLENVNIRGYNGVGAIAGYASTGFKSRISRIDSCYVSGVISGVENVGGLTGSSGYSISHCVNEAIVNGQKNVGGITGYSNAHLQLSSNKAEISGVENVGGIAGTTGSSTDSVSNSGKVTGAVNVGGITGYLTQGSIPGTSYSQSGSIRHSYNTGDILLTGSGAVGGIIGTGGEPNNLYSYRTGQLHENYNMGSITATGSGVRAGGIAGYLYTDTIATCYNTGEIKVDDAGSTVGGLVGYHCVSNNYGIISSYNAGKIVTGSVANVGGIAGYVYNTRSGYWPAPVYSPVFTKVYYLKDTDEDINKDIPATGAWAQPIAAFTAYPEAQTVAQLRHPDIVDSLNEVLPEDLWKIDATPNINSGYPILRLESSSGLRSVSPATLNYPVAGGVQKFAVKSNVSWTVAGSESWVAVSPAAGVNNDSVSVTVTANAGEARNATVTVSDGSESLTVTVKQDGQTTDAETPVITTDPQSADYTLGATATPLTVAANAITDGGTLTWQWYSSVSNSYSGGAA
ncbi:MAG: hypothetical protein LBS43_10340, partial [Prevotellaceae bacterium]|nr:hypothetical protein [Prevotellaceae bacterium]